MKRRGSVLLVLLMMVVILAHGTLAAVPLVTGQTGRERARELQSRAGRMNEALRRYTARVGHGPSSLDELTLAQGAGPYLPRIEEDPWDGSRPWVLTRDETGAVSFVAVAEPSQP